MTIGSLFPVKSGDPGHSGIPVRGKGQNQKGKYFFSMIIAGNNGTIPRIFIAEYFGIK